MYICKYGSIEVCLYVCVYVFIDACRQIKLCVYRYVHDMHVGKVQYIYR